jgi:oligoendopeptidase F
MRSTNPLASRPHLFAIIALLSIGVLAMPALAAEQQINWDLSEIYASDEAWRADLDKLAAQTGSLDHFKGTLASGPKTLKALADGYFALDMLASRLGGYIGMRVDEDLNDSTPLGMQQRLQSVLADLQASLAWIDPEILEMPAEKLAGFIKAEPDLEVYSRYLERLEKRRTHVLDADSEKLLGMMQRTTGVGMTIGGLLRNAEMPWSTITLSDGSDLRINAQGYSQGRRMQNREDRIAAYTAFYTQLDAFKGSLAATLSGTVQEHILNARVRNYESSLEAALHVNEVDPAVYHMLIEEMNEGLPTLHRYLKLRGRILGIDDLRYHDMYPALVGKVTADYSWENSITLVCDALAPLGEAYVKRFRNAMVNGWVDVYPREGKRAGAYVNDAAYEVHPYMLLNHIDDYLSTSTLAHEGGHLMHSSFAQEAQPYATSNYVIFVAEVASTVNEVLLFRHLVANAETDDDRLALLGNFLEGLRTTVFRQTMFAEFELALHEAGERGDPITGDSLNTMYAELLRRYHGEAEGVMKIDDLYITEWAFVPHFHYNYYVYQYATSYVAAIALAEGIQEDRPGARDRYMAFLRAGSSAPPVELLTTAGVDMTSPEPIRAAMRLMDDVMDQIEDILNKQ